MSQKGRNHNVKPCPHCGGKLIWNPYEEEDRCFNCARSPVPMVEEGMSPQPKSELLPVVYNSPQNQREAYQVDDHRVSVQKREKVPVPARVEVRGRPALRHYPFSTLSTNGAWYPQNQINLRWWHMIFLIKSLPLLQEGKYPPNPIGTGYVDSRITGKGGRSHSYFESPVTLAAEVESRLELCGQDGIILEALFCWGKRPEYLMRAFGLDESQMERRVKTALRYISGWSRKERSYKAFRTHKKENKYP